jgi:hypothetical protein
VDVTLTALLAGLLVGSFHGVDQWTTQSCAISVARLLMLRTGNAAGLILLLEATAHYLCCVCALLLAGFQAGC